MDTKCKSSRKALNPMDQPSQLSLLQQYLGLTCSHSLTTELKNLDVVFIAIDFENGENIWRNFFRGPNCQVGISVLDTRVLTSPQPSVTSIQSHSIISGTPEYCRVKDELFSHGCSKFILPEETLPTIQSFFRRERNIVLVGHDIGMELRVLKGIGFDLETSIVGFLDTQRVADEILFGGYGTQLELRHVLEYVRISTLVSQLHVGGNDANFTLRALLLLAERSYDKICLDEEQESRLKRINALAGPTVPLINIEEFPTTARISRMLRRIEELKAGRKSAIEKSLLRQKNKKLKIKWQREMADQVRIDRRTRHRIMEQVWLDDSGCIDALELWNRDLGDASSEDTSFFLGLKKKEQFRTERSLQRERLGSESWDFSISLDMFY